MSAIRIKEIAGVVADAELKFSQQGKALAKVRLAFSDNIRDEQTQEWRSVNQFYVEGTAWERIAEQLSEVGQKGAQLLVWGVLATDQWEDRQTGEKRSKPALKIQGFRPVGKLPQPGEQQPGGFGGGQPQGWGQQPPQPPQQAPVDPWGGQPSGGDWGSPQGSRPPF